jgi:2-succinyl-6-hydroxy-2,4-cyclohexadiene-1-carboxylate synthase
MERIQVADGVTYAVEVTGSGSETLVLLHGFTGSAASWQEVRVALESDFRIVNIDLPGHGQTIVHNENDFTIQAAASSITHILSALGIRESHLWGYSMGGRTALFTALSYPEYFTSLILESASPGLKSEPEKAARRQADAVLAARAIQQGIEAFVDYWEQIPLFASQSNVSPDKRERLRAQRLGNDPTGLANSLLYMGTGSQPSVWDQLPGLTLPTLIMTGSLDIKFEGIGQAMHSLIPNATHITIENAGHALSFERPEESSRIVRAFISGLRQDPDHGSGR